MQVDPIKPTLKQTGTKHLKVKCDKLLSSFAFKFNLRRYTEEASAASELARCDAARGDGLLGANEERAHVLLVAHNTTERLLLKHMCQAGIRTP